MISASIFHTFFLLVLFSFQLFFLIILISIVQSFLNIFFLHPYVFIHKQHLPTSCVFPNLICVFLHLRSSLIVIIDILYAQKCFFLVLFIIILNQYYEPFYIILYISAFFHSGVMEHQEHIINYKMIYIFLEDNFLKTNLIEAFIQYFFIINY